MWLMRCFVAGMSNIAKLIDRARAEFVEMPGLALTLPQAARLWNLELEDCRSVLDVLTNAGFLRWTPARTVVRTGRALVVACDDPAPDVSVAPARSLDRYV
jgi:hypothetical protein